MPLPRVSLRSFLNSAKITLKNESQTKAPISFIIGNESADLDSLCSAIILAYLRTYTSSKPNTFYIPISNIPRADLSLRPELIPVLSAARLKPSDLITLSDLPLVDNTSTRIPFELTKWVLVDHNVLLGELGRTYGQSVVGCIDHHDDEHQIPDDCGDEPRVIKPSGSCSSLVIEYCREAWDLLASTSTTTESKMWDAEVATVALGPALIDTANLTSKVTPTDVQVAKYLSGLIKAQDEYFDTDAYFNTVNAAKQDIGGLSLADILRKDYKQWTASNSVILGISSVVKDFSFLLQKAGDQEQLFDAVKNHAVERSLSVCSIMTSFREEGVFKRELLVWALNEQGLKGIKAFERDCQTKLGLESYSNGALDVDGDSQCRRCWQQNVVESSRKQVAPLLREAIEQASQVRL